jgi:adenylyltransferase/sulfurtransferase
MAELTKYELRRYASQISLPEIGQNGQLKLKKSKVLVIGAGGQGTTVMQYLTAAGIGVLGIADDGSNHIKNLQRQVMYSEKDLGKMKTIVAGNRLRDQNHLVNVKMHNIRITEHNILKTIEPYDLIIDATDDYDTRYLIDDACSATNKTWIFGAVYKFEGQISVFNYRNGPTLRCLYPEKLLIPDKYLAVNTDLFGALPGLIGCYQAAEAIKILLEIGDVISKKILIINILNTTFIFSGFEKDRKIEHNRLFADKK